ncbi:MAG: hypothetical protein HY963_10955 [Ignavibacteriales bacterium]|nr:hypothetical protein [Ignavibacteriales bacterium]
MKKEIELNNVPHIISIQDMILQSAKNFNTKLALEDLNDTPINSPGINKLKSFS